MSRRLKYTPHQLDQVVRIVGRGARLSDACAAVGVKRTSFLSRVETDPDLKARLEQAKLAGPKQRRSAPPSIRALQGAAQLSVGPRPNPAAEAAPARPAKAAAVLGPPTAEIMRPLATVTWDLGVIDGGAVVAAVIGGLTGLAEYWEARD